MRKTIYIAGQRTLYQPKMLYTGRYPFELRNGAPLHLLRVGQGLERLISDWMDTTEPEAMEKGQIIANAVSITLQEHQQSITGNGSNLLHPKYVLGELYDGNIPTTVLNQSIFPDRRIFGNGDNSTNGLRDTYQY